MRCDYSGPGIKMIDTPLSISIFDIILTAVLYKGIGIIGPQYRFHDLLCRLFRNRCGYHILNTQGL